MTSHQTNEYDMMSNMTHSHAPGCHVEQEIPDILYQVLPTLLTLVTCPLQQVQNKSSYAQGKIRYGHQDIISHNMATYDNDGE